MHDTPPRVGGAARSVVRPPLRTRLSITSGNLIQAGGLALGAVLVAAAATARALPAGARLALAIAAWLVIYDCSHSIAHYLTGRAVGIRFRGYGIRGTDHPENYPPGLRQLMAAAPFWTVLTDRSSMRMASPARKAMMFAAGETSTNVCSLLAAGAAAYAGVPGGRALLVFTVVWDAVSSIAVAILPKGDYAKALRALRAAHS